MNAWHAIPDDHLAVLIVYFRIRTGLPSRIVLEMVCRDLRHFEVSESGGEVNRLIEGFCGEGLPPINLAHIDLTGRQQRPEQHRRRISRWQHGLRLDPPLELFVQTFDRVRCSRASPLARRQARKAEQAIAGFLQTVGDGAVA